MNLLIGVFAFIGFIAVLFVIFVSVINWLNLWPYLFEDQEEIEDDFELIARIHESLKEEDNEQIFM